MKKVKSFILLEMLRIAFIAVPELFFIYFRSPLNYRV